LAIVGAPRREALKRERERLIARVLADDEAEPTRAELGKDPGPAALALLAALSVRGALSSPRVRRSLVRTVAGEVGAGASQAELLVALARAAGARVLRASTSEAGAILWRTWRDGGAWDEARADADAQRASEIAKVSTPTPALRGALLDLLEAVPEGRFAPASEIARAALGDLRASQSERLLERTEARHPGRFHRAPAAVLDRIIATSIAIGALDTAAQGAMLRLSRHARRWLAGEPAPPLGPSAWSGAALHVGDAVIARVLEAAEAAEPLLVGGALVLRVTPERVAQALERGKDLGELRAALAALADPVDPGVDRALAAAHRDRPRARFVRVAGFVVIEDPRARARIESDPELRELFVLPSPDTGLLVREDVPRATLARALARHGVGLE
ncbi:MAG: hypothetical protein IT378_05695, partial [Sandaracinaceae bacterium]|nr:hypothetical protein [Sandaracinaceae bacterium]